MSLSLAITANPDVLSLDGSSQTPITIEARDHQRAAGSRMCRCASRFSRTARLSTSGRISARTLVTDSNGRATFTYTAPPFVGGPIPDLQLSVTPTGNGRVRAHPTGHQDSARTAGRHRRRRRPRRFTFVPATPAAFTDVRFDGSTSTAGAWHGDYQLRLGFRRRFERHRQWHPTHRYIDAAGTYLVTVDGHRQQRLHATRKCRTICHCGRWHAADGRSSCSRRPAPVAGQPIFFNGTSVDAGSGTPNRQLPLELGRWQAGTAVVRPSRTHYD